MGKPLKYTSISIEDPLGRSFLSIVGRFINLKVMQSCPKFQELRKQSTGKSLESRREF